MNGEKTHTLTVWNAVDVPEHVADAVWRLIAAYDPDVYTHACDADGSTA